MRVVAVGLRAAAILIAVLAVMDPAWTAVRRVRPEIAVHATTASAAPLAQRVADELDRAFTVIPSPFDAAAATVIVGDRLPDIAPRAGTPVFAVLTAPEPSVTLEEVVTPSRPALHARVPVPVVLRAIGARGRTVDVALEADGVIVDRVVYEVTRDTDTVKATLTYVPAVTGVSPLRVRAGVRGSTRGASADVLVDVHELRRAVLFHDARPSWMSTFVRRSIERDPRFVVSSRVMTSRDISTTAGRPPGRLDDAQAVSAFDLIVVGAPEALTERDVDGLDAYLRHRAGSVLLLFDRQAAGPWERLTRAGAWSSGSRAGGLIIARGASDSTGLRASEIAWPAQLPAGARPIAFSRSGAGAATEPRPVVWQSAIGAGRLVVSGALDAWRFRASTMSAFDAFWRTLLSGLADATPPLLDVSVRHDRLTPGETAEATITLLEPTLSGSASGNIARASVAAHIEGGDEAIEVRFWPAAEPGRLHATFHAPATPGDYRLVVADGQARADAAILVTPDVTRTTPTRDDLLAPWVRAHGGSTFQADELHALRDTLVNVLQPARRDVTWHPMRSAFWIIPFSLLLGLEWWARRREGQL